jgi:hypothetical protein
MSHLDDASSDANNNKSCCSDSSRLKSFDFFKFKGAPRHIAGYQASVTGVVGTIILMAISLAYIANSTYRFFSMPPSTSVTQNPTQTERHEMFPTCITVPHLNDPRYFNRALQRIHLDQYGNKSSTNISLQIIDNDTLCFDGKYDPETYLQGYCSPGNCDFLRFKLWNCNCSDPNMPRPDPNNNQRDRTDCAPLKDITDILEKNYVTVNYKTEIATVAQHTAPKIEASAVYITTFALNKTIINPDLIRSFFQHNTSNLIFSRETYHLQYFFVEEPPFKEVLELQMAMSSHVMLTVENRQTALDTIGSWGAFFSVIASAGALIFGRYNERKFYERNPLWEQIDENFRVERGSDANLHDESAKLLAGETSNANLFLTANNNNNNLGFGRAMSPRSGYNTSRSSVNQQIAASYGGVLT